MNFESWDGSLYFTYKMRLCEGYFKGHGYDTGKTCLQTKATESVVLINIPGKL